MQVNTVTASVELNRLFDCIWTWTTRHTDQNVRKTYILACWMCFDSLFPVKWKYLTIISRERNQNYKSLEQWMSAWFGISHVTAILYTTVSEVLHNGISLRTTWCNTITRALLLIGINGGSKISLGLSKIVIVKPWTTKKLKLKNAKISILVTKVTQSTL